MVEPSRSREYSKRLGVISADQLQAVADEFGLGRVIEAEPAPGGLFGQVVFITTTGGAYVWRGNPHGHAHLTKERRVARLIHERSSLPAPWPYLISENTERFGWTYAVMPRLPGATGSALWDSADDDQRIVLAAAYGEALGRLHETTSPFVGPYDDRIDDFVQVDDFPRWVLHRLDRWRAACRAVDALSTEDERFIDALIDQHTDRLAVPFEPVLVHHDFHPSNLNLEATDAGFAATGVFDLFEAYFGDGEEDLVRMLQHLDTGAQRGAFVDAYAARRPLRTGASDRLALYALADFLIVWEYGRRNRIWFEDVTFGNSVRPIIDRARAIAAGR